jgi:hypothetical protein
MELSPEWDLDMKLQREHVYLLDRFALKDALSTATEKVESDSDRSESLKDMYLEGQFLCR